MINAKKKIIDYIFEINTFSLEKKNKNFDNFYEYISGVIKSSHFLVRLSYKIIIYKILIIYFFLFIFLLNKNNQKIILKIILKTFEKFFLFKNIFKLLRIYSLIYFYE